MNFMFEFSCIISLYYIKKQQDATLAVLFIRSCILLVLYIIQIGMNVKKKYCSSIGMERLRKLAKYSLPH